MALCSVVHIKVREVRLEKIKTALFIIRGACWAAVIQIPFPSTLHRPCVRQFDHISKIDTFLPISDNNGSFVYLCKLADLNEHNGTTKYDKYVLS